MKIARTVLRGERKGNLPALPDQRMVSKRMKKSIAIFIFLIVLFPRVLIADSPITYPLWELVAQVDLIIVGVPHVPLEEIQDGIQGNTSHYIVFEVIPQETLKGKTKKQSLEIIYWPLEDIHRPSPLLLRDLDGKEAILFLDEIDDNDSQRLYFAGHTPEALQPFNDNMIIKIKDEVVYQQKVLKRFKKDIKASELAHYDIVKTLIRELTNKKNSWIIFEN